MPTRMKTISIFFYILELSTESDSREAHHQVTTGVNGHGNHFAQSHLLGVDARGQWQELRDVHCVNRAIVLGMASSGRLIRLSTVTN